MRALQFLPYLESVGFSVHVSPLFDNSYVTALQLAKPSIWAVISGYTRRLQVLLTQRKYDLIWVEKESLPWIPFLIESIFATHNTPYVVDYDDAVFHRYDQHHNAFIRKLLGTKIDNIMRRASLVIVGNEYLAQRAIMAGAVRVSVLPTVLDIDRYFVSEKSTNSPFCVGWIGQASTVQYVKTLEPALRALFAEGPVTFRAVGPINWRMSGCPLQVRPWSEETEAAEIQFMDVGVMPLRDEHWERGKCGYKLLQYMATGKPVIASPIGVNTQIIEHGVTGYLASMEADWVSFLRRLRDDPALRRKMGNAGRKKVEALYSLQVTGPRLAEILKRAVIARRQPLES